MANIIRGNLLTLIFVIVQVCRRCSTEKKYLSPITMEPEKPEKAVNDQFAAKSFQEVVKKHPYDSVAISAYSISSFLAYLALTSGKETREEIIFNIMHLAENAIEEVYSVVNERLRSVKDLKQETKIFVSQDFVVSNQVSELWEIFNVHFRTINFSNAHIAWGKINTWMKNDIHSSLKSIDDEPLNCDTNAILINAIYWKGVWKEPFSTIRIETDKFFVTKDQEIATDMMTRRSYFEYGKNEELDAQILRILYDVDQTSLVIILPNQIDGVDNLIERLIEPTAFSNGLQNLLLREVMVKLPKFRIKTTVNLKEILQCMNISKIFTTGKAQLENLIEGENNNNFFINDVFQNLVFEVNEKGAPGTAKGRTKNKIRLHNKVSNEIQFKANHPFVFYVMERNNIILNGVFRGL